MKQRWFFLLVLIALVAIPLRCPAPLVYRPGEGWTYESVGGGKWQRARAKDQLQVAEEAFDRKDYSTALKAARRTVKVWQYSDSAPRAQYLLGRVFEIRRQDEKAFEAYQRLLEKYPKVANYDEVLKRQYEIANRFLAGQWFKLWGYIPFFPNMDRTVELYDKILRNGPYSDIAPQSQMNIAVAREKQKDYLSAVKAYERAADRYSDRTQVASDAGYKAGLAYLKESLKAEYDQGTAGKAMATFTDFIALYPEDPRTADAQKKIAALRTEQARGSYEIARYYEKTKRWQGARVYYADTIARDPDSKFAALARKKLDELAKKAPQVKPAAAPVEAKEKPLVPSGGETKAPAAAPSK